AAIEEVYPTRNPLSAPAWSLDRLAVRYRTGQRRGLALISPARQDAFLSLLGERAGLRREGAELRRVVPGSEGAPAGRRRRLRAGRAGSAYRRAPSRNGVCGAFSVAAASMRPRWLNPWGKFPSSAPLAGSTSSDSSPTSLANPSRC